MDILQHRIALLQRWLDRSSQANAPTPCGHAVVIGQFGSVLPVDLDAEPPTDFDLQAFPLFVPYQQCEGTGITIDHFDPEAPASQDDIFNRIQHVAWKCGTGELPVIAVAGVFDPSLPLSATVERDLAGLASDVPVILLPLWQLAPGGQRTMRAMLPILPRPGAIDGAVDDEPVRQGAGVRDIWD